MENKIEIGEYVRTEKGNILKIEHNKMVQGLELLNIQYGNIINHSKDIIDLIEVGDIVDGNIVSDVDKIENRIYIEWANGDYINTDRKCKGIIKSILTHEQYERNAYRLEE